MKNQIISGRKQKMIMSIALLFLITILAVVLVLLKNTDEKKQVVLTNQMGYSVYIETGHGKGNDGEWDAGCSWSDEQTTYEEAILMIPIARSMANYLRKSGVTVYTDAYRDNDMNLIETLDFIDHHKVDAFINIHCDWEEADSGTMPLYRTDEQKKLAKALNSGVHGNITIPDRGLVKRTDLDTLNSSKVHCPAVLFETGSIKADNELLRTHYDQYGKGLAIGLCRYFGIPFSTGK